MKLLFVCHGNICRSPMAELCMKQLAKEAGIPMEIRSAATSREEIGNSVYPSARAELARHGISAAGKRAVQMTAEDYQSYDLILAMDQNNLRNLRPMTGGDPEGKVHLLLEFTDCPGEVDDPWYTGDFETAWREIERGCRGLLKAIQIGTIS